MALRAAGMLAALALLWTLAIGWWLPRFLQPRLEAAAATALGAPLAIGRLEIAPWRLALVASELRLGPAESPWLRVARIEADASSESLVRLAPVLERVRVVGPSLVLERLAPGRFNVSPLLEALARRPARAAEVEPQRFALQNLTLEEGSIRFLDRVARQEHRVEALQIGIPFVSNLPAHVEIHVEPLLAARIDGSPLRLSGKSLPFSAGRRSSLDVDWRDIDVPRWLDALAPLLPAGLPLELQRGRLDAALRIGFEQRDAPAVPLLQVEGRVALTQLEARMPTRGTGLASPRLELEGLDLRPLERRVSIARIAWQSPAAELDLPQLLASAPAAGSGASSPGSATTAPDRGRAASDATADADRSAASSSAGAARAGGWQWRVAAIELADGRVLLRDAAWPDGQRVAPLSLRIEGLDGRADAPPARLALALADARGARLAIDGSLSPARRVAQLKLDLAEFRPGPWLAPWQAGLPVRLLDGNLALQAALEVGAEAWSLHDGVVKLSALQLEPPGAVQATPGGAPQAARPLRSARGATTASVPPAAGRSAAKRARETRSTARRTATAAIAAAPADRLALAALELGGLQIDGRAGAPPVVRAARLTLDGLELHATRTAEGHLAWLGPDARAEAGAAPRVGSTPSASPPAVPSRSTAGDAPARAATPRAATPADSAGPVDRAQSERGATGDATPSAEPAWRIAELACNRCSFAFHDAALRPAAIFGLKDTRFVLHDYGADPAQAVRFELTGQSIGGGHLKASGSVRPRPLAMRGRIDVDALDLRALQPYLEPHLNVALASARAHAAGELQVDGDLRQPVTAARWRGRLGLAELRALDRHNDADLLRWRSLRLDGADLRWTAAQFDADLGDVSLDGFYGRLIVNADGRLNLLDIVRREGESGERSITTPSQAAGRDAPALRSAPAVASAPAAAPAPTPSAAAAGSGAAALAAIPAEPEAAPPPAAGTEAGADATAGAGAPASDAPAVVAAASAPARPAGTGPGPQLRWRAIRLANGAVDFTDNFIRPNYSARLSELSGEVAALAWNDPQPAVLSLAGRVDGSAPLEVSGTVHPLGPRLATDITASARGIDITRLTGYSGRYAGYGIEKGTLSLKVHYKLDNGRLEAHNNLYLDQLTFGDKVESPDALKLPVLLAVSLLKDRHGVIDIDLPIRGSLDDPQFSIGGVILRVIGNLIAKAVTAPFSLLAGAFGSGGEELGHVEFGPGSSELGDAARARLDTLARALDERPALKLEATGQADAASDAAALRASYLERLLRAAKARSTGELPESVKIEPAERTRWLEAAYKAADLPDKPRNLIGLAKSVPPEQMEALLLQGAPAGEAPLRALADERGDRVKAYLVARIAPERVLLTASRLGGEGGAATAGQAAPRVEFKLR